MDFPKVTPIRFLSATIPCIFPVIPCLIVGLKVDKRREFTGLYGENVSAKSRIPCKFPCLQDMWRGA